jgi:hypothetical protein
MRTSKYFEMLAQQTRPEHDDSDGASTFPFRSVVLV